MGVLQRFERRLEGLVEGAFARVFKGVVEPVEVARALQREAEDRKAIVGRDRVLVPNEYVVLLGPRDHERLAPYSESLGEELAEMVRERADDQGWSFVGPVQVRLEEADGLGTGKFRVYSEAQRDERSGRRGRHAASGRLDVDDFAPVHDPRQPQAPVVDNDRPAPPFAVEDYPEPAASAPPNRPTSAVSSAYAGRPRLTGYGPDHSLNQARTVIGRAQEADLRLGDNGVSRRHAEVRIVGDDIAIADLGSTNGTRVNGRPVREALLADGDRVEVGQTTLVFRRDRS